MHTIWGAKIGYISQLHELKTIVDGMEQNVKAGDVITMSAGCRHTVIAETELKLIEVQLGKEIDVNDKQKFELEY